MRKRRHWLVRGMGLAAAWIAVGGLHRSWLKRQSLLSRSDELTARALAGLGVSATSEWINTGTIRLHTVLAGPPGALLVVLLHGFPECWYTWRKQIPVLVRAGFRVAVPDQRGYNLSDRPPGIAAYQLSELVADCRGLIQALGYKQAAVVGHDWGGIVAWQLAIEHPEMVSRLIVLNAPHPAVMARELQHGWHQRLRSLYGLFFQIPWLPEGLLGWAPAATARLFFVRTAVRSGAFSEADLEVMAAALARPGTLTAMLNWYRAALRYPNTRADSKVSVPTLLIWGENDPALDLRLTQGLDAWVPVLTLKRLAHCGHWVQNEAPAEVNALLPAFLAEAELPQRGSARDENRTS